MGCRSLQNKYLDSAVFVGPKDLLSSMGNKCYRTGQGDVGMSHVSLDSTLAGTLFIREYSRRYLTFITPRTIVFEVKVSLLNLLGPDNEKTVGVMRASALVLVGIIGRLASLLIRHTKHAGWKPGHLVIQGPTFYPGIL
jgi:hypothetical protein